MLKVQLNIIFPSVPKSSKRCTSFRNLTRISVHHTCYMSRPSHPPWCDQRTSIWLKNKSRWPIRGLPHSPVISIFDPAVNIIVTHSVCVSFLSFVSSHVRPILWTVYTRRWLLSSPDSVRQPPEGTVRHSTIWNRTWIL